MGCSTAGISARVQYCTVCPVVLCSFVLSILELITVCAVACRFHNKEKARHITSVQHCSCTAVHHYNLYLNPTTHCRVPATVQKRPQAVPISSPLPKSWEAQCKSATVVSSLRLDAVDSRTSTWDVDMCPTADSTPLCSGQPAGRG